MSEKSTALTVVERAKQALVVTQTEEELKALAAQSVTITAITNNDGREQVHSARMALKNTRVEIERLGKEARDDATKFSKAVIAEEKRLIALIKPEEERLQELQTGYDDAIEAEKQRRIQIEIERVHGIRDRIEMDIRRAAATSSSAMPSERVAKIIEDVAAIEIDDSFAEFRQEADDAKVASLSRLREIHAASVERETEQARIKAEREELARLRAEDEKRQAAERARIAEEERVAKAARDAEAAKQAAELKAQREQQAADAAAERKRIADEEAAAKAIRDADAKKLAAERAEFEQQQAAAKKAKEEEERAKREQARLASIKKPADDELLAVLAKHYSVPAAKVVEWILAMDLSKEIAA